MFQIWNQTFIGADTPFELAEIVILGAPFDGTASFRPGSRFGPQAVRTESEGIETYSPYQDMDLEDYQICDAGDMVLPFGDTEGALDQIQRAVTSIVDAGKAPFIVGGEHLITLPAFKAVLEKHPDLCLIHFDAHTDLREDYLGNPLSHATVIRRIWDLIGDNRIFQFGIRSGTREEFHWAKEHTGLSLHDFSGLDRAIKAIGDRPVYFTLDLDVLDPSIMPGTGTTEAGGVSFMELMRAIVSLSELNLVGMDMVELTPHLDISGVSTAVACKLVREMLLAMSKRSEL